VVVTFNDHPTVRTSAHRTSCVNSWKTWYFFKILSSNFGEMKNKAPLQNSHLTPYIASGKRM